MDFNTYDFHGNPRPLKENKEEDWCTACLMYTPTNMHLGTCDICGEPKPNTPTPNKGGVGEGK